MHLQVLDTEFLTQQADSRHLRTESITAHRGTITDRNGEPLAISTPVDSIWANPKELALAEDRIPQLARVLGIDRTVVIRQITSQHEQGLSLPEAASEPRQGAEVMALKLPGVNIQREYRRYYPAGEVAGHLVGFTNIDDKGQEGLELAYDYWLAGESGAKRVLKDRLGRSVEECREYSTAASRQGTAHEHRSAHSVRCLSALKSAIKATMRSRVRSSCSILRPAKFWRSSTSRPTTRMIGRSFRRALPQSCDHRYLRTGFEHQAADRRSRAGKWRVSAKQHRRYGTGLRHGWRQEH